MSWTPKDNEIPQAPIAPQVRPPRNIPRAIVPIETSREIQEIIINLRRTSENREGR